MGRLWVVVAAVTTVLGIVGAAIYFYLHFNDIQNEDVAAYWGDVVTAVAFVWLLVSYSIQWEELALQRNEMALQREVMTLQREEMASSRKELAAQAEALQAQVAVAKAQADTIQIQAEIGKQSSVIASEREFVAHLSAKISTALGAYGDSCTPDGYKDEIYASHDLLHPFRYGSILWGFYSNGYSQVIFDRAAPIFRLSAWLMERQIDHHLTNVFPLTAVGLFKEILLSAARYSELLSTLRAEKYDQRPFAGIAYACWEVVRRAQLEDSHFLIGYGADEDREIVTGAEWIRRSGESGIEEGIRYLFEGDIAVFSEVAAALPTEEWIQKSAQRATNYARRYRAAAAAQANAGSVNCSEGKVP